MMSVATKSATRRAPILLASVAVLVAGCSGQAPDTQPTPSLAATTATAPTASLSATPSASTAPSVTQATTATAQPDSTAPAYAAPVPEADLPGTAIEFYFSEPGGAADVVGIAADASLAVRALPQDAAATIDEFSPTGEVTLAGRERRVNTSVWTEVETANGFGWVRSAQLGYVIDAGREVTASLSGTDHDAGGASGADYVQALGQAYAAALAENTGASPSLSVTLVDVPESPTGPYIVDILGLPDDAILGERLEITLLDGGNRVTAVTSYAICGRGVSGDLCV